MDPTVPETGSQKANDGSAGQVHHSLLVGLAGTWVGRNVFLPEPAADLPIVEGTPAPKPSFDPAMFGEQILEVRSWSDVDARTGHRVISRRAEVRSDSAANQYRYETEVFVAPPWKEIYTTDDMRKATYTQSEAFYSKVVAAYRLLGYNMVELPKTSVEERAAFITARLP